MVWLPSLEKTSGSFEQVFSLRENLYADYLAFIRLFWQRELVDVVAMELCRLRVAQLHQCAPELNRRYRVALDAGLNEEKISVLPQWPKHPSFSDAERACLQLAEMFVLDPHGISDEDAESAKQYLGDAGLVALMEVLAMFDGFSRFQLMLSVQCSDTVEIIELEDAAL